jgi:hypothetical protein
VPNVKPGFASAHATGTTVDVAFLAAKIQGVDFALDAALGTITELTEFGAGNAVLASYTADFLVPARYPAPANDSPDLGETSGEWSGKSLVDGACALLVRATRPIDVDVFGEVTTYHVSSREGPAVLLFGSAAAPEPYTLLSPPESCNACHQDLEYHDGRYRGPIECLTCHGASGLEDVPRYVAANAPATPATTVAFRSLVHRIHRGQELALPDAVVVGAGSAPWPDNFTLRSWERVRFPALPGRTLQCAKCHGDANTAALYPHDRGHPSEQGTPVQAWRDACATCHDATSTLDHIDTYTMPGGVESCSPCHGPGAAEDVVLVHEPR